MAQAMVLTLLLTTQTGRRLGVLTDVCINYRQSILVIAYIIIDGASGLAELSHVTSNIIQ